MDSVLTVTDEAIEKVLMVRGREDDPESLALWIEITGRDHAGHPSYDLWLAPPEPPSQEVVVERHGPLTVVLPAPSVPALRGSVLDRQGDLATGGLVVSEPVPASPAIGTHPPADLSGDAAQRILRLLDEHVNPAIAAHGGSAELVAVEDGVAYLRLGGGCHGCGMAAVTLRQGIEVAIHEAAPEITRVVDVTDHAAGTNPYYQPAGH